MADKLLFLAINLHKGLGSSTPRCCARGEDGARIVPCCVQAQIGQIGEIARARWKRAPGATAIRELQEEMGFESNVRVVESLGMVRYAFTTPQREIRLKAMHLFLCVPTPPRTLLACGGRGD